ANTLIDCDFIVCHCDGMSFFYPCCKWRCNYKHRYDGTTQHRTSKTHQPFSSSNANIPGRSVLAYGILTGPLQSSTRASCLCCSPT
ncbi:unnamed protein product, partial [Arctogadus glacialis]